MLGEGGNALSFSWLERGKPMRAVTSLLLAFLICLSTLVPARPAAAQAATQTFRETGFAVADTAEGRFLSEFRRLGGVDSLGYPISRPFVSQGFTYQLFQRGALQWRPEAGQAVLANVMDWLADAGKDAWLETLGIPRPLPDSGGAWPQVVAERESWLSEPAIAQAYRRGGGYNRYGLPASRPERAGPFLVQRFQRYAFQLWLEEVPGMPAKGNVVGVLAGDLLKQAGLLPAGAESPEAAAVTGCQSNPSSVVKSNDVDIVRYRFIPLAWDNVGLEVTVRNNCPEPRRIRFGARVSPAPGTPPIALGGEQEADFGPGEEKGFVYDWTRFDGSYPQIAANQSVTFHWNWTRQGSNEQPCLDVGAQRCLTVDPWLRSTVQELATVPSGADLLRRAANSGAFVTRGELRPGLIGSYRAGTGMLTLSFELDRYSEFERAEVLSHELRHAIDDVEGQLPDLGPGCLEAEFRAFREAGEAWYALWGGNLPQPQNQLQRRFNDLAALGRTDPNRLKEVIGEYYADQCKKG